MAAQHTPVQIRIADAVGGAERARDNAQRLEGILHLLEVHVDSHTPTTEAESWAFSEYIDATLLLARHALSGITSGAQQTIDTLSDLFPDARS